MDSLASALVSASFVAAGVASAAATSTLSEFEARQIARGRGRILAHHISDWLVPTRDLVFDRGMMGDGVIDLAGIRRMIEAAGFDGPQEVEIFSAENWWKRDPAEVVTTCVERYQACCRAEADA